jgi:hypothetical protein
MISLLWRGRRAPQQKRDPLGGGKGRILRTSSCVILTIALWAVPPKATAQAGSPFPQGIYIAPDTKNPHAVSRNAGVEIGFTNGLYELHRDGELRVNGRYATEGDSITFTDMQGAWACGAQSRTATYNWRVTAGTLVLTPIADACNRRRNRLSGSFILGRAPSLAESVKVPSGLRHSWERFWLKSDEPHWLDDVFTSDAIAEDGNRRLVGIDQIRAWLSGQDSEHPQAFPFEFSRSAEEIVEKGRYRDIFRSPDGSSRLLVGRYQITWTRAQNNQWKVREWLLR